ncbi:MAG: protein kinase, partial [Terriglobales bacterium]
DAGSFLEKPILSEFPSPASTDSSSTSLVSGTVISGRFEILGLIGQGGMGQVYEVLDRELQESIALKAIRPEISSDPNVLSRFRREVQLTRRITHTNVCRTFDIERCTSSSAVGVESDFIFLTMELLKGETLAELLRREKRLTPEQALPLIRQMVEAFHAAHSVGVVHRDFKPSNVVLVPSGEGLRVVVTDFGLARMVMPLGEISADQLISSLSSAGGLMGTLAYMSPEQLECADVTQASDIYALGLVIYEMVTGRRPFVDPIPFAEAVKRIKQRPPSASSFQQRLDSNWEETIRRCLAVEPSARFASVLAVGDAISGGGSALPSRSLSKENVNPSMGARSVGGKLRTQTSALVICFVALALFGFVLRYYLTRTESKIVRGSTMLLTEVRNNTGDPRFDGTTELVRRQLLQSPHFNLVDAERIQGTLDRMNKPQNTLVDPSTAREVALRSGAARVAFGGVSRIGDNYILDIAVEQPDNNPKRSRAHWESHWTWQMRAENADKQIPSSFLGVIRDAGDWIRSEVGEPGNDIASVDMPPEDVTTGNWIALSEFAQAEKFKASGQTDSAIVALQNAVTADPGFALAHMRLGDLLISMNRHADGYRAYDHALAAEQRERLTRREKDRLDGIYAHDREDFKTAEAAFQNYSVYYPNDYIGWFYRAYPLMMLGRPEEALTSLKRATEIDPNRMFALAHIARFDLILNNFDDASKWIRRLRDAGHEDDADIVAGEADFLQARYTDAQSKFEKLKIAKDPLYRSYGYSLLARLFAELGQYKDAVLTLDEGIAADLASGDSVHRADKLLDRAYLNFKRRQPETCLKDVAQALALDRSHQRSLLAGTLLGRAASASDGATRKQLRFELGNIQRLLPAQHVEPLSSIVRARLTGEGFLLDGYWEKALEQFRKAEELEAPVKDKEYLARAYLLSAARTKNSAGAVLDQGHALTAYSKLTLNPGQVWQWALDYPPGYLSDQTLAFLKISSERAQLDVRSKALLSEYLTRRSQADSDVADMIEAKRIRAKSLLLEKTN